MAMATVHLTHCLPGDLGTASLDLADFDQLRAAFDVALICVNFGVFLEIFEMLQVGVF